MTYQYLCHDALTCNIALQVYSCSSLSCTAPSRVSHGSFILVTWLIHIYDVSYSYVWRDSFIDLMWLIHMFELIWLIHTRDKTHPYTWNYLFKFHTTPLYAWHDLSICVTWLIHTCAMIHSHMCRDSYANHMCDLTHLHVWYDPFLPLPIVWICVIRLILRMIWFIHICVLWQLRTRSWAARKLLVWPNVGPSMFHRYCLCVRHDSLVHTHDMTYWFICVTCAICGTYTHTNTHTHTQTQTHTHTYTHTHARARTHTHTHTHKHARACARARAHTNTRPHPHLQGPSRFHRYCFYVRHDSFVHMCVFVHICNVSGLACMSSVSVQYVYVLYGCLSLFKKSPKFLNLFQRSLILMGVSTCHFVFPAQLTMDESAK